MTDPYQILNVSPNASDDEIKKAYRDLARKYHPDHYHDNPLADLAQEKMKEINAAYDTIQRQRSGASSYSYQQSSYQSSGGSPAFQQVRLAINRNDLALAERLLGEISNHNGEWNYLKGAICMRRGWLDEARRYFQTACQMEPNNMEYRQALERMEGGQTAYRPGGYQIFTTDCMNGDNVCLKMGCAYLLCTGCGAGGIPICC